MITHLSCIVKNSEVSCALEVRLDELWVGTVRGGQLLYEGLVCSLREPTLFVHQGHDAHWLEIIEKYIFLNYVRVIKT